MASADRRERQRQELRQFILHTAGELILTHGYEQLTIRSLARAIEYSPRTIYLHFGSKEELLQEIVEHGFRSTAQLHEQAVDHHLLSARERICRRLALHIRTALGNANMYRVVIRLLSEQNGTPGPAQHRITEQVKDDLLGFAPGSTSEKIDIAAAILLSAGQGFAIHLINSGADSNSQQTDDAIQTFVEFTINGLQSILSPRQQGS